MFRSRTQKPIWNWFRLDFTLKVALNEGPAEILTDFSGDFHDEKTSK